MSEVTWLPQIDQRTCTGCGDCVTLCPTQALALAGAGSKAVVVQPQACNYCAVCEALCPAGAIALPYVFTFEAASPPGGPSL
jgi:NAD-dependent dihydropyrimidine dehydrogenase PreA subunit